MGDRWLSTPPVSFYFLCSFTWGKVMTTSEPKNKKISTRTVPERFTPAFSASSESRRSFLEDCVSSVFAFTGPYEPVLLDPNSCQNTGMFRDIREIILEKNKTRNARFFAQENSPCITAIVPSNFSGDNLSIFAHHGHVFGSAKTPSAETCGKVRAKVICSEEYNHDYYYKHERCNDPDCPMCYSKFAHKLADRVVARVLGYTTVYPEDAVDHVVLWPHVLTGYRNLQEAYVDAHRMLTKMGSVSSVVWYHPYRIRGDIKKRLRRYRNKNNLPPSVGFWVMAHDDVLELGEGMEPYVEYGPHFHALSTGYLMDAGEYSKLGLGGYKKVRRIVDLTDLEHTSYYLSTHACWEHGRQSVRYYGKISTSKLAKGYPRETIEDVVCKVCGKPMVEYYCDDADVLSGVSHDHVTRRVISYLYWKRGMKPRVPVYQELQAKLPIGDDTVCLHCGLVMHKQECFNRGYKYRYVCANENCCKASDSSNVWYDGRNCVTTPPR